VDIAWTPLFFACYELERRFVACRMGHHSMHLSIPAFLFFEVSRTANSMSAAGIVLLLVGIFSVRRYLTEARGLDKVVALSNLCFAMPLAAFGAEHLSAAQGISQIVPKFMPWPLFWAYFVGFALVGASFSIATKVLAFWAGLLFGTMMFLFVAMMDLPGTVANLHNRISWTLMFRELSFGAGGWMIAAAAMNGTREQSKRRALATVGCVIIGVTAVLYGIENFLHPINVPGVPLEMVMPTWIPARPLIGYVTSAILVVAGLGILSMKKSRMAATYLGTWILLLVIFVYGPILVAGLLDPSTAVKVEGLNYFFDTLLFAGTVLALAGALEAPAISSSVKADAHVLRSEATTHSSMA